MLLKEFLASKPPRLIASQLYSFLALSRTQIARMNTDKPEVGSQNK